MLPACGISGSRVGVLEDYVPRVRAYFWSLLAFVGMVTIAAFLSYSRICFK